MPVSSPQHVSPPNVKFFGHTSESHRLFADGDTHESPDPADVTDTDVYKELAHNIGPTPVVIHDQVIPDEVPDAAQGAEESANQTEAGSLETASMVVIDQFPHSSAGAPIPGMAHGSSAQELCQDMHADSVWAPFKSQCDWQLVHWAKIHGPTALAVTRLLEIPEVCAYYYLSYMSLINA